MTSPMRDSDYTHDEHMVDPLPQCIQGKSKKQLTLIDCVYLCLRKRYRSFWEIQNTILDQKGRMYGEPSISAAIRALRHPENRDLYNLETDLSVEVVDRRRRPNSQGYEYKIINRRSV